MDKTEIFEILLDWNYWKNNLETGIPRKGYLDACLRLIKPNVILAIIGARRAGKSYVMRQMAKKMIDGGLQPKEILIVNFEDRRFTDFSPKLLERIYETYLEYLKPSAAPYIFLDEVHNISGWERWVRTMHELKKAKIIISGSSSKLLSGELATVLTGRHLDVAVFPIAFREFLDFNGIELKDTIDILAKKIQLQGMLREYMEWGGFPEVVLSKEKTELLFTYFDDIITKDIERRYKVRKGEILRSLARFYLTNISKPVTFNSIKGFVNATIATIDKFSGYFEEVNLLFFIRRFSFSTKEQEKSPRKVYSVDVGLSNAIGFRFSENIGRIAENIVAVELKRRQSQNQAIEIYYWKDQYGKEVDFIIKEQLKIRQLIQVCWNLKDRETRKREIKALLKASEELRNDNLLVITEEHETEEKIRGKTIKFVPLWKWLLEQK